MQTPQMRGNPLKESSQGLNTTSITFSSAQKQSPNFHRVFLYTWFWFPKFLKKSHLCIWMFDCKHYVWPLEKVTELHASMCYSTTQNVLSCLWINNPKGLEHFCQNVQSQATLYTEKNQEPKLCSIRLPEVNNSGEVF